MKWWSTVWICGLVFNLAADDWRPLFDGKSLKGWRVTDFAGRGEVETREGSILLRQGVMTGINYTNATPKTNFEVRLEARRVDGSDFFCGLTFPVKDSHCSLIVGGWGGGVVGLSCLDGQDAAHNDTTKFLRFEAGRWYKIRLRVADTNISTWIDEEQIIDADLKDRTISLRPGDIELSAPFGIASWSTTAELRKIELRSLGTQASQTAGLNTSTNALEKPALPHPMEATLDQLVQHATNSVEGFRRFEEFCDRFGHRLVGSTNLEAAIQWITSTMTQDGLEQVRGEPVTVRHWIRGKESVELVEPNGGFLPMLGLGGSCGTGEEGVTAPLLVVGSFEELVQRAAEATNRIVLFNAPFTNYRDTVAFRVRGAIEAAKAGAKASLVRSVTPFSMKTPHTGMMVYDDTIPKIPHAAITPEDADRLTRMCNRGLKVTLRMKMGARNAPDTTSHNVVAEIRGRERPDEIVVAGGHIDSWDVGQGAQDDAAACLATWEAFRLIRQLNLRPRRTLRCVLWTSEENGGAGARAYRDRHVDELAKHVVALESDNGIFAPRGFSFVGSQKGFENLQPIAQFLQSRLAAGALTRGGVEADVAPLLERGVPVMGFNVDPERYFWYHHTEADTVDKVSPVDFQNCTAALAAMIYALGELEDPIPR